MPVRAVAVNAPSAKWVRLARQLRAGICMQRLSDFEIAYLNADIAAVVVCKKLTIA
ncbi:MAG TPA: hypothetical protein VGU70_13030 [Methylobacterium sp.]|jgi:hypothetical protein|uniref:hypothetical protein n=1 Tax=Methylorubrum sp. B1-46 TaxID=2897334 RepID=UPI001E5DE02F|nr:hypothetical protein [Methylorubrum sp. B1-46]UGB26106.1 hypothetical protein LPC10_00170 [Methylorubrum sp. B1-46]HEV2543674.1 hypothetical protein [Methylobacterium sp.]